MKHLYLRFLAQTLDSKTHIPWSKGSPNLQDTKLWLPSWAVVLLGRGDLVLQSTFGTDIQWVVVKDAAKHPTVHTTALTTKHYLAPNANSDNVERPCPREWIGVRKGEKNMLLSHSQEIIPYYLLNQLLHHKQISCSGLLLCRATLI